MAQLLAGYTKKQNDIGFVTESVKTTGKTKLYINGPFQIYEEENQNGRRYPKHVLQPEIERYLKEYVQKGRAFGELDHPENPEINGHKICHRVVDLWEEGNVVMGRSLILGTSMGREVRAMLEDGGVMGVSSRSLGDVDHNNLVTELHLICWDVVQEPSVSAALMESLSESKNWDLKNFIKDSRINIKEKMKEINKVVKIDEQRLEKQFRNILKNLI